MTFACRTFFTLPELLLQVIPYISVRDLTQLLQTNRIINSICTPAFWRSLNLSLPVTTRRLIASPKGLQTLLNNIDNIQSVAWGVEFSWHYICALWKYLDSSIPALSHQPFLIDPLSCYGWDQLHNTTISPPISLQLPPLPALLHLKSYTEYARFHDFTADPHRTKTTTVIHGPRQCHILWLLRLNHRTLTYLNIELVTLIPAHGFRDFCYTLSQLKQLRILRLSTVEYNWKIPQHFLEKIFLYCPASLVKMTLPQLRHEDRLSVEHSPTESGWEFNQEPWLQREEPYLYNLRTLEFPDTGIFECYNTSFLSSILRHSPSLQKLKLPLIKYPEVAQGISKALENHCSNLTDLTIPSVAISQEMFSDILKAIPEQRLKKLCAIKASDTPIRPLSATVFPRHSESLRCIKLHDCKWLPSKTLQAILISCKSLEVLIIKNDLSTLETTLELEDAVESIWACTEINELDIPITITPDGRNPKYFDDPTMKSWTEENYNHWKMLDMFYTQIGSLKELRRLYLRAAGMSDIDGISSNIYYKNVCLPGLLALEDSDIPKIGFLSKLEGLVRLQEFGGSVSWQTEEALATIGEPEINWFVQHLPGLKQACFIKDIILEYEPLPVGDNVPETVREVNRRRPGLALGPSFDELFEYV